MGLPEPEIEEVGGRVRVTLHAVATAPAAIEVDDVGRRILDRLGADNGLTTAALAAAIERTARTTRTRLAALVDAGLVIAIGSSPNDPHRRYYLADRSPP
jgi:xanthine/CO dehydrogenase XdhC/CoxF family maturation factor